MKPVTIVLLLLLLHSSVLVKAQIIKWDKNRRLTWDDFKGKPDVNSPNDAVTRCSTSYSFYCKHTDSVYIITFKIRGGFDTQTSWAVERRENQDILKHEQLHFDIHELYMRKLMAAFNAAKYTSNYREEIKVIYQGVIGQMHAAQVKYDTDVKHPMGKDMQLYWEDFIHTQLDHTSPVY